jgi:hypothetical protein
MERTGVPIVLLLLLSRQLILTLIQRLRLENVPEHLQSDTHHDRRSEPAKANAGAHSRQHSRVGDTDQFSIAGSTAPSPEQPAEAAAARDGPVDPAFT